MKRIIISIIIVIFLMPLTAGAQKKVNEYGEEIQTSDPAVVEQVAPEKPQPIKRMKKEVQIKEYNIDAVTNKKTVVTAPKSEATQDRIKRFRAGLTGPGIGVANQDIGALMVIGLEGEYFFFERLSAGLKVEGATKFKDPTIISFTPMARYIFDFDRFPHISAYVQAGIGAAVYKAGGTGAAADFAIPGGGLWWQWRDHWSFGAETSLHFFVRSSTTFGFTLTPTVRYLF